MNRRGTGKPRGALGRARACLAAGLAGWALQAHGMVLWRDPGPYLVRDNGAGREVLHGAVKGQDDTSGSTLFFKFTVDPLADVSVRPQHPFTAGLLLCERGQERLGVGVGKVAFAYSTFNATGRGLVTPPPEDWVGVGEYDLNGAFKGARGSILDFPHRSVLRTILFRVQYIPGGDAQVTVWFQPDLTPGNSEFSQLPGQVTRFKANACFDELRLVHRGAGDGWRFSDLAIATSFEDFVTPHLWQRGWFIGLTVALLGSGLGSSIWLGERRRLQQELRRLERARALDQERARIARDLHDELGARLTQIQLLGHAEPGNGNDRARRMGDALRQITALANEMVQTLDGIVWAVNPKNDNLSQFADYLARFADEFFRLTPTRCRLDVPVHLPAWPLSAQQRHALLMTVKEACHNVVRHARATDVWLRLRAAEGVLVIGLEDNGCGFSPGTLPERGNGLRNQRDRIATLGGRVELVSAPGQGTHLKLMVPLSSG